MSLYIDDTDFQLFVGDALDVLRELPSESVHCVITSPPYWSLRDYGCEGQLGLEPTPDEYVANMVNVFREVQRVLRSDGTLWLNIGDSYAGSGAVPGEGWDGHGGEVGSHAQWAKGADKGIGEKRHHPPGGLKPKDLVGIPWLLAFALQADGWYLRSDIIWSKPNPMPESVTDRPTKAHEYLFLLTKSPRYFYDADAIREAFEAAPQQRLTPLKDQPLAAARRAAGVEQGNPQGGTHVNRFKVQEETLDGSDGETPRGADGRRVTTVVGKEGSEQHRNGERWPDPSGRNKRSVWEIATAPYPDAHFATFPPALVEPCVKAGTSEHGCCPACGAPWEREMKVEPMVVRPAPKGEAWQASGDEHARTAVGGTVIKEATRETLRWIPSCICGLGPEPFRIPDPVPCTVLDPFMGSGTTAQVARRLGRRSIGIELNPEYAQLCARRLQQQSLFA